MAGALSTPLSLGEVDWIHCSHNENLRWSFNVPDASKKSFYCITNKLSGFIHSLRLFCIFITCISKFLEPNSFLLKMDSHASESVYVMVSSSQYITHTKTLLYTFKTRMKLLQFTSAMPQKHLRYQYQVVLSLHYMEVVSYMLWLISSEELALATQIWLSCSGRDMCTLQFCKRKSHVPIKLQLYACNDLTIQSNSYTTNWPSPE